MHHQVDWLVWWVYDWMTESIHQSIDHWINHQSVNQSMGWLQLLRCIFNAVESGVIKTCAKTPGQQSGLTSYWTPLTEFIISLVAISGIIPTEKWRQTHKLGSVGIICCWNSPEIIFDMSICAVILSTETYIYVDQFRRYYVVGIPRKMPLYEL